VTLGAHELQEAEAALEYFKYHPEVRNVGIIGISMGRVTTIRAAAQEPRRMWVVLGGNHGINYALAGDEYKRRVLNFFRNIYFLDLKTKW
jgi:dienelactone hydrolase